MQGLESVNVGSSPSLLWKKPVDALRTYSYYMSPRSLAVRAFGCTLQSLQNEGEVYFGFVIGGEIKSV